MKDLSVKLQAITAKYREIEKNLSLQSSLDTNNLIKLNKEYADLTPLVEKIDDYKTLEQLKRSKLKNLSLNLGFR